MFDPASIAGYVTLAKGLYELADKLIAQLRADGVTDQQLAEIDFDYTRRIARRKAERGQTG